MFGASTTIFGMHTSFVVMPTPPPQINPLIFLCEVSNAM